MFDKITQNSSYPKHFKIQHTHIDLQMFQDAENSAKVRKALSHFGIKISNRTNRNGDVVETCLTEKSNMMRKLENSDNQKIKRKIR